MSSFRIHHLHAFTVGDDDDNVDSVVELQDGRSFAVTFFTLKNIESLMKRWQSSGEAAGGSYFWAVDAIILRSLSHSEMERAIADMLKMGFLEKALTPVAEDE